MLNMYWDLLLNGLDTEDSWSLFRSNILELSDKYIPKKEQKVKQQTSLDELKTVEGKQTKAVPLQQLEKQQKHGRFKSLQESS